MLAIMDCYRCVVESQDGFDWIQVLVTLFSAVLPVLVAVWLARRENKRAERVRMEDRALDGVSRREDREQALAARNEDRELDIAARREDRALDAAGRREERMRAAGRELVSRASDMMNAQQAETVGQAVPEFIGAANLFVMEVPADDQELMRDWLIEQSVQFGKSGDLWKAAKSDRQKFLASQRLVITLKAVTDRLNLYFRGILDAEGFALRPDAFAERYPEYSLARGVE
jgi:hypothetical protein